MGAFGTARSGRGAEGRRGRAKWVSRVGGHGCAGKAGLAAASCCRTGGVSEIGGHLRALFARIDEQIAKACQCHNELYNQAQGVKTFRVKANEQQGWLTA